MVFTLLTEFAAAVEAMPAGHPRAHHLKLVHEAVRRDVHFIEQDPTSLFQCVWNSCWWYDCPPAAACYTTAQSPGADREPKLYRVMEEWRARKEAHLPGFVWLRSLRPPATHLGTGVLAVLRGHEGPVNCLAYSPDGQLLATGSDDYSVRVWDAVTGQQVYTLRESIVRYDWSTGHDVTEGGESPVRGVAFTADGRRVMSAGADGTVWEWDLETGESSRSRKGGLGQNNKVKAVAFAPDGSRVASAPDWWTVEVWDFNTGRPAFTLAGHDLGINAVQFSPDGRHIATASEDGTARVWDAADGRQVFVLDGDGQRMTRLAYTPDGAALITGSPDNTLRVWDAGSGRLRRVVHAGEGGVQFLAVSPDGRHVASGSVGTIRVWNADDGRPANEFHGPGGLQAAVYSPDGRRIAGAAHDWTVRVWDAATDGSPLQALVGHEDDPFNPPRLTFSPDGRQLASVQNDPTARLWDVATGEPQRVLRIDEYSIISLAFSPDSRRVATGSCDGLVRVWDTAIGAEVLTLRGHEGHVVGVAWSPDGTRLATASEDNTIRVWGPDTGRALAATRPVRNADDGDSMLPMPAFPYCLAFSPDGRRIASGWDDCVLRMWDAETGALLSSMTGQDGYQTSLAFSPDGSRIASCACDQRVWVWDVVTGQSVEVVEGTDATGTVAAGSDLLPRATRKGLQTEIVSRRTRRTVARFPTSLEGIAMHPSGRLWAGSSGGCVFVLALEGNPDALE